MQTNMSTEKSPKRESMKWRQWDDTQSARRAKNNKPVRLNTKRSWL